MRVGAEDADAVALLDAEVEEGVRELVGALLELAVGEAAVAIDHGGLVGIELGGAAQKIVDKQRNFHREPSRSKLVEGDSTLRRGLVASKPRPWW
jgi:hypothetical protein